MQQREEIKMARRKTLNKSKINKVVNMVKKFLKEENEYPAINDEIVDAFRNNLLKWYEKGIDLETNSEIIEEVAEANKPPVDTRNFIVSSHKENPPQGYNAENGVYVHSKGASQRMDTFRGNQ